ncbi:hypothetical protein ANN_02036 [Periplaneta americana]|uniref:Uncharacterized protein n=1 Tax=Periplaneta americana TaxID=6978 RepID=A0ABQ8TVA2_PERAM|nr:hypothetical protein ANN_02036 [Periplaneta americana]
MHSYHCEPQCARESHFRHGWPREFILPTLPQRRITYVPEKLPSKYGVHSEEYLPIRTEQRSARQVSRSCAYRSCLIEPDDLKQRITCVVARVDAGITRDGNDIPVFTKYRYFRFDITIYRYRNFDSIYRVTYRVSHKFIDFFVELLSLSTTTKSTLDNSVVVITEDVQNVHLLLEYRPHIDVSLTCEHDPKLQEYCVCPQNMPQFDSEGIPNQTPETNKPMILNGPTSRNREGSAQVRVEAKQLGHLYLSIDQETFDPSTGEPYV